MANLPGKAALLERRFGVLGPRSPLFYDDPLQVVRGEGVWLYDAAGRRYLDAYNNVPHVGHCHPRVVEAISRQAACSTPTPAISTRPWSPTPNGFWRSFRLL